MAIEKVKQANKKKAKSEPHAKSGKVRAPHDSHVSKDKAKRFHVPNKPVKPGFSPMAAKIQVEVVDG
jgi:hypothetical protein